MALFHAHYFCNRQNLQIVLLKLLAVNALKKIGNDLGLAAAAKSEQTDNG